MLEVLVNCQIEHGRSRIRILRKGSKIILPFEQASIPLKLEQARKISQINISEFSMYDYIEAAPRLLELVTPPATEPVTLSEAKSYLRVDTSAEDSLITSLIAVSRQAVENYIRKSLITQTWKLEYNDRVPEQVLLPMGPVQAVSSVLLTTRDGDISTLDSATYYLNAAKLCLVFDVTPEEHKVTITYTAGYGSSASSVPTGIKQAILTYLAALFDGRDESQMPEKTAALLAPFRMLSV